MDILLNLPLEFYFLFLVNIGLALLAYYIAKHKGHEPAIWFIASFLLSGVIVLVILAALPEKDQTNGSEVTAGSFLCPFCGASAEMGADACPKCSASF